MAVFKCKMCGGDLEINAGVTVVECEYCGTKQTVPSADNEKKVTLFGRANRLRFACEFDKAAGIYESIVADFPEEAEAYWGLVLCKYGIEYVDDPATAKKIPTCHRSSFDSVLDDSNFDLVLENADVIARGVYREEAKQIEELRKGIIEVSSKEEPYDIFICYKETADNGDRTVDSVIAQDVYNELTSKGYRVFFSRITLEDKLGQEYEPYIFAALNSAKIMLAFGTTYEYYNAVWVKNEWSRFLQLIAKGEKKTLIPCYKDIDAYDMPKEFAKLQAQDMGKVGAIQDLLRGIEKLLPKTPPKVKETVITGGNANTDPLLERAFMFLEDEEWESAEEYCEKALDMEPKCAKAYLGKLMVELCVKKQEDLIDCAVPFNDNSNFQKAVRFADEKLKKLLVGYIEHINTRNERAIREAAAEKERCRYLFKEYKAALQNETLEETRKSEAASLLHSLNWDRTTLLRVKNNWQQTEESLHSLNQELSSIELEIDSLKRENSDLGLFAVKRKKEIKDRLETINSKRSSVTRKIEIMQEDRNGYHSLESICDAIENLEKQIEDHEKTVEAMSSDGEKTSDRIRAELSSFVLGQTLLDRHDKLANPQVGDYIFFGTYEQDNDLSNGKEDIEWLVLEVKEKKMFVISKCALDCKKYNEPTGEMYKPWSASNLRKWLNNDFVNTAFSSTEKKMIPMTSYVADKELQDKVFLLDITEAKRYFCSDSNRECEPTAYALSTLVAISNYSNPNKVWWLRSAGYYTRWAAYVVNGKVEEYGSLDDRDYYVRPAMWIDLNDQ